MDILRCFLSGFTGNFTKQDVKKTAKLFSTKAKNFGKIAYLSKKRNLVFSPGLEVNTYFRSNISFIDPPLG